MIRSTIVLIALLTVLAGPALAQDRRASEAEAAAARAEEAAADAMRAAARGADLPADAMPAVIEPLPIEPLFVEPIVEPVNVEPAENPALADAPIEEAPALAIDWIAEPVVQPLGEPASNAAGALVETDNVDEPAIYAATAPAREDAPGLVPAVDDTLPIPSEPMLAYASPLDDAAQPAPRAARRTSRRVQLAYSPAERDAWLAQCRMVYRGSYDCDGYLAHYERALGATTHAGRVMPAPTIAP